MNGTNCQKLAREWFDKAVAGFVKQQILNIEN